MTTITEIIALLGHACGLPWGTDAVYATCPDCGGVGQPPDPDPIAAADGHVLPCRCEPCRGNGCHLIVPSTLAEWTAEWERDHPGEPGPVAEWKSDDGRVWWRVEPHFKAGIEITVQVANCRMWRFGSSPGWVAWPSGAAYPLTDWAECVRLMQAVDGAR